MSTNFADTSRPRPNHARPGPIARAKALPPRIPQADLDQIEAMARGRVQALTPIDPKRISQFVADALHARRSRNARFGDDADIFGEPAWDMLLELYLSRSSEPPLSIGAASVSSAIPTTTALRYVALLEGRGLIVRQPHPYDRRSSVLRLTDKACEAIEAWYRQVAAELQLHA